MAENENDVVYFAKTNFRNQQRKFGIKTDDRRRHMYFIGKTGMGKTTVLENMMIQDVQKGHGLAVVDPHGDFVEKILDFIPASRINDVVYINPADAEFPVAFNVLESVNPSHRHLVASGLLAVFKKMWVDSWGPRLEYILRNCILSLMEYPGSTLLGIMRILVDNEYRRRVIEKLNDPIVKAFWVEEFSQYAEKFRTEAISPIQNKIGQFLSSSLVRNIVGQPKSSIDLREIMDNKKILLLNLAKGRIGEDNAGLLGGMMITKLQVAAMSRVDVPEKERKDFFLYVDEFQNFATESFANILSEARKYRLNLVIAHQYIEQLDEKVAAAVFGNVGTIVCFRVGAADAEFLAKEFAPLFDETDLVNLTKYDVYLRLMIDGVASDPFSATTLPPVSGRTDNADKVIAVSRERYANKRETVEEKIRRWSGVDEIYTGTAQQTRGGGYNGYRGGERQGGQRFRDDRPAPAKTETPPPKFEELEPVVLDTGEQPISLTQAIGASSPKAASPQNGEQRKIRSSPSFPTSASGQRALSNVRQAHPQQGTSPAADHRPTQFRGRDGGAGRNYSDRRGTRPSAPPSRRDGTPPGGHAQPPRHSPQGPRPLKPGERVHPS